MTEALLRACRELAMACGYEDRHAQDVVRLALAIFDGLKALHGLHDEARAQLHAAAILHDIGWTEGAQGHHKVSQRTILTALPVAPADRAIIACVARYHRKALPSTGHAEFAALGDADRHLVQVLSAILRVADGLDATHRGLVEQLALEVSEDRITLRCRTRGDAHEESQKAVAKSDLMAHVFGRRIVVTMGP